MSDEMNEINKRNKAEQAKLGKVNSPQKNGAVAVCDSSL
jgi:hypothetical protein